jgi:hypothetical protein
VSWSRFPDGAVGVRAWFCPHVAAGLACGSTVRSPLLWRGAPSRGRSGQRVIPLGIAQCEHGDLGLSRDGLLGRGCVRAAWLCRAAAALARTRWVAVSQAQASEMTRRGDPDRSTGPEVRFPAPVIVALSSPNVVSEALHLVRYASRTASAGAARWSRRVVIRVHV